MLSLLAAPEGGEASGLVAQACVALPTKMPEPPAGSQLVPKHLDQQGQWWNPVIASSSCCFANSETYFSVQDIANAASSWRLFSACVLSSAVFTVRMDKWVLSKGLWAAHLAPAFPASLICWQAKQSQGWVNR